jgi:hypothetical protein
MVADAGADRPGARQKRGGRAESELFTHTPGARAASVVVGAANRTSGSSDLEAGTPGDHTDVLIAG